MTPPSSVSLLDTLHVLDLAAQVQAGTLTRAQQVVSTQALNTGHTLAELELAAEAHLGQGAPGTTAYDFGWERPATPEALAVAQQRYARGFFRPLNWILDPEGAPMRFAAIVAPIVLGWAALSFLTYLSPFLAIFGVGPGMPVGGLAILALSPLETRMTATRSQLLGNNLLTQCLAVPSIRAYLRAVLMSRIPYILGWRPGTAAEPGGLP